MSAQQNNAELKRPSSESLINAAYPSKKWKCEACDMEVMARHISSHVNSMQHKTKSLRVVDSMVEIVETAFRNRIITFRIMAEKNTTSYEEFLKKNIELMSTQIKKMLAEHGSIKVNLQAFGTYMLPKIDAKVEVKSFNSRNQVVTKATDLTKLLNQFFEKIFKKTQEFSERDSGWTLVEVLFVEININKYDPLRGGSYIDIPREIKLKHACINVKNSDENCFAWAVISALYPASKNSDRVTAYPKPADTNLNFDGLSYPVSTKEIKTFEENNQNISINVYTLDERNVVIVETLSEERRANHINLLFLQQGERTHYCWIKSISRLVRSQYTKYEHHAEICDGCLLFFRKKQTLEEHQKYDCRRIRTFIPQKGENMLKFTSLHKQMKVPFAIYADFECLLQPFSSSTPNPNTSYTIDVQQHVPISAAYYVKCSYSDSDEYNKFKLYRGEDCIPSFLRMLEDDARWIYSKYQEDNFPMQALTPEQQHHFDTAPNCELCGESFEKVSDKGPRVRDHDHFTGLFRCVAHQACNLKYKVPKFIPVLFHNLSNYDSHLILKQLGAEYEDINVIAINKEKYISFSVTVPTDDGKGIELRFLDSYRFMASSLEKLAQNLTDSQMSLVQREFPDPTQFAMTKEKGVFCYDYFDSLSKLDETSLPDINHFFNQLTQQPLSQKDYDRALRVWEVFNIRTLGEYSDLYLKVDTLLLACVFENFRDVCLQTYGLDALHYYTAPGLSWDSALKITGIELELLTEIDQINFIKRGIRGGISQVSGERLATANNIHLSNYDSSKPSSFLFYLDANNLYGHSLSDILPYKGFRWVENHCSVDIFNTPDDASKGYILEVDLAYPQELHDEHADLPFCAENKIPPYSKGKQTKLLTTLEDKKNYIIHYRNLKQAVTHGLKLTKIHRILEFSQAPWLRKYIELNNKKRTACSTEFEKDFYKLMNNAVYGKTMENVEKRKDIRIRTHWENIRQKMGANDFIRKPHFQSISVINESHVVIQMKTSKVTLNKPTYLGFTVLELSKLHMYNFHYDKMKKDFPGKIVLLYTDTDSLIYKILTFDLYNYIRCDIENNGSESWFDTSNFDPNNKYKIPQINEKELGKFKNECGDKQLVTVIAIRSKSYCNLTEEYLETEGEKGCSKKLKGVQKSVVDHFIKVVDFENCLENNATIYRQMRVFRTEKHVLFTRLQNKIALSPGDDKRFLVPDGTFINTLPWGHYRIPSYQTSAT